MINEHVLVLECELIVSTGDDIHRDSIVTFVRAFHIGDTVNLDELNINGKFARVNIYPIAKSERARRGLDKHARRPRTRRSGTEGPLRRRKRKKLSSGRRQSSLSADHVRAIP